MKLQQLFACAALAVMLSGLNSCSGDRVDILDTVPADAKVVVTLNATDLCRESGIKFDNGNVEYDPLIQGKTEKIDESCRIMARMINSNISTLDRVVLAETSDLVFATFGISSFPDFSNACGDYVKWGDDAEGMHVGTTKNQSVVASDTQVWITEGSNPAAGVKALLETAKKNPISKIEGINRALTTEALVNVAVLSKAVEGNELKAEAQQAIWNVATVTAPDNKLAIDWCMMKGDGEKQPVKGLQQLNPAVLAYVSGDPVIAVAAGFTSDFDWNILGTLASFSRDFQAMAMMQMALPYLSSIDGTVMLAASPLDVTDMADTDPGSWKFTLMAHMPQDKINALLDQVRALCFTSGITPKTDPRTGIISINNYGLNLYMGNVDGYMAISNHHFSDTGENPLAPLFVNKEAAARVAIPSLKPYGPGLPAWGLNINASVAGTDGKILVTLPGTEGPVLVNILSALI
ncbi:MAG: hypothetical protein NC339_01425 [Muribaculaceae bacterium]|nr:hypothetical protein [Muribaculaceae bacterium]